MRKFFVLVPLLCSSCILIGGQEIPFPMNQDIPPKVLERYQCLIRSEPEETDLGGHVICFLPPLFFGMSGVNRSEAKKSGETYQAFEFNGTLLGFIGADGKLSLWDEEGINRHHATKRWILFGLLYHDWEERRTPKEGAGSSEEGFSIAWGLFKKEKKNDDVRWTILWIPGF